MSSAGQAFTIVAAFWCNSFSIQHINGVMFILYPFAMTCATVTTQKFLFPATCFDYLMYRIIFAAQCLIVMSADINNVIPRQSKK